MLADGVRERLAAWLAKPGTDRNAQLDVSLRLLCKWRSALIENEEPAGTRPAASRRTGARRSPRGAGARMTPGADGPGPNCALRYVPDGFRVDGKAVKGRQSAGAAPAG